MNKKEEVFNVHDDAAMIAAGLGLWRHPLAERDKTVWSKTKSEKKKAKRYYSNKEHFYDSPMPYNPTRGKLVINLKRNNKYNKSTYSTECWQEDIPFILSRYREYKNGKVIDLVVKASFDGRSI